MSFSIAVQEATGPTRSTDMGKSWKIFQFCLGYGHVLAVVHVAQAISIVFVWTYQRQSDCLPLLRWLVGELFVCMYVLAPCCLVVLTSAYKAQASGRQPVPWALLL